MRLTSRLPRSIAVAAAAAGVLAAAAAPASAAEIGLAGGHVELWGTNAVGLDLVEHNITVRPGAPATGEGRDLDLPITAGMLDLTRKRATGIRLAGDIVFRREGRTVRWSGMRMVFSDSGGRLDRTDGPNRTAMMNIKREVRTISRNNATGVVTVLHFKYKLTEQGARELNRGLDTDMFNTSDRLFQGKVVSGRPRPVQDARGACPARLCSAGPIGQGPQRDDFPPIG